MNKYGLVWDEERVPEDIVIKTEEQTPYIEEVKKLSTKGKGTSHILIEGDNYASLTAMQNTHKNSIDIICVDPPYNTGNEFIYNDKRVDDEDNYRHSKWLNFMNKRMRLAYNLLKDDGICYIFIGHDELANLILLSDQIFGRQNRLSIISRRSKAKVDRSSKNFSGNCDYILVYSKTIKFARIREGINPKDFKLEDENGKYKLEPLMKNAVTGGDSIYDITCPNGEIIRPTNGVTWSCVKSTFHDKYEKGMIVIKPSNTRNIEGTQAPFYKKYLKDAEKKGRSVKNFLADNSFLNDNGSKEVRDLFDGEKVFDYPKPTALIKHLIKITNKPNNITVMDFFAGSGTTGHAVIDLNAEDEGTRSSIMCALNDFDDDADICTDVTYKRLKLVIDGWRKKYNDQLDLLGAGFPPTIKFFKTKHASNNDPLTVMRAEEITKNSLKW